MAQSHMVHGMARDKGAPHTKAGQRRGISAFPSVSSGKDMEVDWAQPKNMNPASQKTLTKPEAY